MSSGSAVTRSAQSESERMLGRVKWFNNGAGYGFITVTDGSQSGSDIFVHHSAIGAENQYRYLVQGEYVEFELQLMEGGSHKYQATHVSGIKGGKLMCETRNENKKNRTVYKNSSRAEGDVAEAPKPAPRAPPAPVSKQADKSSTRPKRPYVRKQQAQK